MLFSAIWLNIVYVDMSPRGLVSVTQRPKGQGGYCVNYLQAACNELLLHVSDLDYEGCKLCSHACSKHYLVTSIRCIKQHLAWPNDKGLARGYSINYLQAASSCYMYQILLRRLYIVVPWLVSAGLACCCFSFVSVLAKQTKGDDT